MMAAFCSCKSVLLSLGQDAEVVNQAYRYILMMTPSMFLIGQHDIQRKFLIQMGKPNL